MSSDSFPTRGEKRSFPALAATRSRSAGMSPPGASHASGARVQLVAGVSTLECPYEWCSNAGQVAGRGIWVESTDLRFERRGKLGGRAVFKCRECSSYLLVRSGLLGVRSRTVPAEIAGELDYQWATEQQVTGMATSSARYQEAQRRREREADERRAERQAIGKPVECPACTRRFVTEADRDSHVRAKHPQLI